MKNNLPAASSNQSLSNLIKDIKTYLPTAYARFNPRVYKNTDRWHDPRFSTLGFTSVVGLLETTPIRQTPVNLDSIAQMQAVLGTILLKHEVPTYFVEKELLNACINTKPLAEIEWRKIKLPFPAGIFILPRNTVFFSDGSELQYIAYGRIEAGNYEISRVSSLYNPQSMFAVFSESLSGFSIHHIIGEETYIPPPFEAMQHTRPQDAFSLEMNQSDHEVGLLLVQIVFNLICALDARPELKESGKRVGSHKRGAGELWTPHIIGGNYRVKMTKISYSESERTAPRLHWRRGHFRNQAYGENFQCRRTIWLEPVLVSGH